MSKLSRYMIIVSWFWVNIQTHLGLKTVPVCHLLKQLHPFTTSQTLLRAKTPQWGAADAEIKVPSGENTELKRSPFKAWSGSVCGYACCACCQGFLPYFYRSSPFTCIFSKTSLNFFLCWLWLTPVLVWACRVKWVTLLDAGSRVGCPRKW